MVGPLAVVATLLALYVIDCLLNGFINLVYVVASGGLICAMPTESRRRMSIENSSEREQLPWSPRCILGGRQLEDPMLLAEPLADQVATETSMRSIPQAQLAHRYRELARHLKNQGLAAEAKSAWIHALDLLTEVASSHPELPGAEKSRWDCANDIAWFLINEPDPAVGDPQLAVRLASQTTQADPEAATYWNTLGPRIIEPAASLTPSVLWNDLSP